jgi:hypothetical protein
MIDDDLRRGYGVCEETGRGNLSSSKSSRAARTAMLILCFISFICGWRKRVRRLEKGKNALDVTQYGAAFKLR